MDTALVIISAVLIVLAVAAVIINEVLKIVSRFVIDIFRSKK